MKINLVLSKSNWTSFHHPTFRETITDYFNIIYVEDGLPPKQNSLLVSNLTEDRWYLDLYQQGYRVILDLLWGGWKIDLPGAFKLVNPNWFWYNESLLYKSKGYDQYIPNRQYVKKGLMPMGLQKESHDLLFDAISPNLDEFIFSYIERLGKHLPNDAPHIFPGKTGQDQRYFNPEWYDLTCFSLVSETTVDENFPLHITEKTFKPIAFQHPYLLWAQPGILKYLQDQGFETYENIFDESYDHEIEKSVRLKKVVNNVKEFKSSRLDTLTTEKIQHNHQRFFNIDEIKIRIKKEIVEPIIEFFEKN